MKYVYENLQSTRFVRMILSAGWRWVRTNWDFLCDGGVLGRWVRTNWDFLQSCRIAGGGRWLDRASWNALCTRGIKPIAALGDGRAAIPKPSSLNLVIEPRLYELSRPWGPAGPYGPSGPYGNLAAMQFYAIFPPAFGPGAEV